MHDDDPRHGTHAGYKAHQKHGTEPCQPCRDAAARYQYERERDRVAGVARTVSVIGFRRRVEALRAIGWSVNDIAEVCGLDVRNLPSTTARTWVRWVTHQRLTEAYERMCMHPPTDRLASRRKTIAIKRGCYPPLAWDEIDNPAEKPNTGHARTTYPAAELVAEYEFLTGAGVAHGHALQQLGVTDAALERARHRAVKRAESEAA